MGAAQCKASFRQIRGALPIFGVLVQHKAYSNFHTAEETIEAFASPPAHRLSSDRPSTDSTLQAHDRAVPEASSGTGRLPDRASVSEDTQYQDRCAPRDKQAS